MIEELIRKNFSEYTDAIYNHMKTYELNAKLYELRLYVDESGAASLKDEEGYTPRIWNGKYYVLCRADGENKTCWDVIGDVLPRLAKDDDIYVLDDVPEEKRKDEFYVRHFVEENYPKWVDEWLEEAHANNYDTAIYNIEAYLDSFPERVEEEEEE